VHGTLIIDKPTGITSHDVVARVRRIIGERRVGHTGTLDPFATGVLVVLVGKATRLLQFLSGNEKEYEAAIRFGYATDTGDVTGQRVDVPANTQAAASLRAADIETAMASLRGEISQIPPMYSAKQVKGQRLYELARRGEQIEREPVAVTISQFDAIAVNGELLSVHEDGTAELQVRIICSAGTYVRTLAEDLGKRLGIGAHVATLRRTRAGRFAIESAITLERLDELADDGAVAAQMISLDDTVGHLPAIVMDESDGRRVTHGRDLELDSDHQDQQRVRMQNVAGELLAVGIYDSSRRVIHPTVVFGD
jgi:tRNA pseudouridine55 synthase